MGAKRLGITASNANGAVGGKHEFLLMASAGGLTLYLSGNWQRVAGEA